MLSNLKVVLILASLDAALAIQCLYFPRDFFTSHGAVDKAVKQHRCNFPNNYSTRWNEFVKAQENFILIQQCVIQKGNLVLNSTCADAVKLTFKQLYNSPLCCSSAETNARSCIFEPLDPCLKGEKAGPESNLLSLLCEIKHSGGQMESSAGKLGLHLKSLHYYTAGCFNSVARHVNLRTNDITLEILSNELCHKAGANGCCGSSSGCNLPSRVQLAESFYAATGPGEVVAAIAQDPTFRGRLLALDSSVSSGGGGSQRVVPAELPSRSGRTAASSLMTPMHIVAASVGALTLACLAFGACLLAICLRRRRRRCSASGKSPIKCPTAATSSGCGIGGNIVGASASMSGSAYSGSSGDPASTEKLLPCSSSSASSSASTSSASAPRRYLPSGAAPPNSSIGGGDSLPCSSTKTGTSYLRHADEQRAGGETSGALLDDGEDGDSPTSSGTGLPILVPRTVAREVELCESIGQGRFGQVFRAVWRNDPVAVKIFSSRAESSWSTEGHMYVLPGMRHDAILGFIAIDNIDIGDKTQLWLISDYHANGSLQSYLTRCTVSQLTMARMLGSIASGLAHLHSEITGVKCKPAIAHRDIKSNNILVKADLTCCIADFDLAVAFHPVGGVGGVTGGNCDAGSNRVGTRRYLSPECLDGSLQAWDFTGLRKADVYAMGLVFWELAARCDDPHRGVSAEPEYRQPYSGLVSANPSLEEMQAVVCQPVCARPQFATAWLGHPWMERLCRVMTECWYAAPAARLEAMSVKDQAAKMLAAAVQQAEADATCGGGTVVI